MPGRPCLGCGAIVRGSYCRRCDPAPGHYRAKRGSGWAQSAFRAAALKRSAGRCERCGSTDRVEAHHRQGVAAGGTHDAGNGEALCWSCHRR